MPSHKVNAKPTGRLGFISPGTADGRADPTRAFTAMGNKAGTSILFFEYLTLATPFDWKAQAGKHAHMGGILRGVDLNPKRSDVWIARLTFDQGFVLVDP